MDAAKPLVRGQKLPWLAFVLNLIPLVGLAGCAAGVSKVGPDSGPIWLALFLFGAGYLYLGRWLRVLLALMLPWVICIGLSFISFFDFEHKVPTLNDIIPNLLALGVASLFTAIDAMRLAIDYNAHLSKPGQDGSASSSHTSTA